MSCIKEQTSQHFQGVGAGHGCVDNSETVVLAVFDDMPTEANHLKPGTLRSSQLRDGNVSLSRLAHTPRPTFETSVIAPRAPIPLLGVVVCQVQILRGLLAPIPHTNPPDLIRAVCVTDKLESGDHAGHAALEYCEEQQKVTNQKTKALLRAQIGLMIASAFGDILAVDDVFPNP